MNDESSPSDNPPPQEGPQPDLGDSRGSHNSPSSHSSRDTNQGDHYPSDVHRNTSALEHAAAPSETTATNVVSALWHHTWGRVLLIATTVAVASWALRETAVITQPVISAGMRVVVPLAIGFTVAYVLAPVIDVCSRYGMNRRLSVTGLFIFFAVMTVFGGLFLVPALVQQSTDLARRTVADQVFVDYDNNGQFDKGDAWLTYQPDQQLWYVDDNGNQQLDETELQLSQDDARVQQQQSLSNQLVHWFDRRQIWLENMLGVAPDLRAAAVASWHRQYVLELTDGDDTIDWQAWYNLHIADDDTVLSGSSQISSTVQLPWLGTQEMTSEQARLPQLQQAMERLQIRHQDGLAAWRKVREGEDLGWRSPAKSLMSYITDHAEDHDSAALQRLQVAANQGEEWAYELYQSLRQTDQEEQDNFAGTLSEKLRTASHEWTTKITDGVANALTNISGILNLAIDLLLIPIYAFFLLIAMPSLRQKVKNYIPRQKTADGCVLFMTLNKSWRRFSVGD